jgi:polyhydroxyalkanoate synthesis repressor PhaR
MSTARVIRKYPNRRLYDTEDSRYITLSDIRALVVGDIEFSVIDKKSGHDITRTILLQVISEQEQQGDAIMSRAFLSQVIRSHARRDEAHRPGSGGASEHGKIDPERMPPEQKKAG